MAVRVKRGTRARRPYGTILALLALAVALVWVIVPLSRGEDIPDPRDLMDRFFGGEVLASETDDEPESGPAPGKVRIYITGREIPAYTKVTRDDLWNPTRNTWAYQDIDESLVESGGVLVDAKDIVGRVMAKNKPPGYGFTEKDFLPKGTRPGFSAGIPAGKRAMRIDVEKVHGIVGLRPGDRFDIVSANTPLGKKEASTPSFGGLYSNLMSRQVQLGTYQRARVSVLVQNGIVVTPLETRQVPTTSTTLTRGTSVKTIPVQEMVIALDPEEVAPFMEALSIEATITCLARSGHVDDPLDSYTPSSDPRLSSMEQFFPGGPAPDGGNGKMSVVESITDNERLLVPVPGASRASGTGDGRK